MNRLNRYALFIILGLALAVRLYHIQAPLIGFQSWRQCDTAAMARNFTTGGYNIMLPQVDWAGDGPGYVETEFPVYPFIVAQLYRFFGVHEFFGRLISIAMALVTIVGLYSLVKRKIGRSCALWASGILAVLPLNVYYTRAFMNESMLLMCSVLGVLFFDRWMREEKATFGVLSALCIASACMIKPMTLYLGLPLLFLGVSQHGWQLLKRPGVWLFAVSVLAPVVFWYYHAHQTLLRYGLSFGIWEYGSDKWGNWSLLVSPSFWNGVLFQSIAERHLAWFGLPILVTGIALKRQTVNEKLFDWWLVALVVYVIVVARGNFAHEYYQLPFLLPFSVFMAKVFSRYFAWPPHSTPKSLALSVLVLGFLALGVWRYSRYMMREDPAVSPEVALADVVRQKTDRGALLVAVDRNNPMLLYLAERKGWHAFPDSIDQAFLANKISHRATYLAGLHSSFATAQERERLANLMGAYDRVFDDGRVFLLRLATLERSGTAGP